MSSLKSVKSKMRDEVNSLIFHVEFVPSRYLNTYRATHEELGIVCYGLNIEDAIQNARNEAISLAIMAGSLKRAILLGSATEAPGAL